MQYNITYREKDKSWQFIISYKDNSGKWKQKSKQGFEKSRRGKQLAKDAAEKMVEELKRNIISKADLNEHEGISFKEFTIMFIEHEKLYKESNTIKQYGNALNAFSTLNEIELSKIKVTDIQRCVDNLIKKELKNATISSYLTRIKVIFNSAMNQYKIITDSPIKNIDIPKDKISIEKTALTKTDAKKLLSKIKNRKYYIVTLIAYNCGLRLGEILGLTWNDIDDKRCIVKVNKQWKILKDGNYGLGVLKCKNSYREVPISFNALNELLEYKKNSPLNIDSRIVDYHNNDSLSSHLSIKYKSLGYDISIHELRHTYATMLISSGVDFKTAAKLLGHDVEMTMKTYSHVTDEMLDSASKIINNIF